MDTTLRDGEQTPEISYTPAEKLQLAQMLLEEVGVDRIEVVGTRVSEGEREAARQICAWARKKDLLPRIEMLGYVDGTQSVDWLESTGGKVLNLLTKGSERHCLNQLRMPPEQHRKRIADVLAYARKRKVKVNVYLEDWSQGVKDSPDYVFAMMRTLTENPVERVYLADTLGVQSPKDTARYVDLMVASWPDTQFEFHCHNDYGLANANCLAAVEAGARGVHTSVNGLGERAGNTRLAEVVAALHDHGPWRTGVNEKKLVAVSRLVEIATGKEVSATCSHRPPASTPTATRRATSTNRAWRRRASAGNGATRWASSPARRRSTRISRSSASSSRPRRATRCSRAWSSSATRSTR
jgi:D-citramalate synthase